MKRNTRCEILGTSTVSLPRKSSRSNPSFILMSGGNFAQIWVCLKIGLPPNLMELTWVNHGQSLFSPRYDFEAIPIDTAGDGSTPRFWVMSTHIYQLCPLGYQGFDPYPYECQLGKPEKSGCSRCSFHNTIYDVLKSRGFRETEAEHEEQ